MSKMIIMQGLPASGKSTKAKEIVETGGNFVRINKDLLRTMLHFGKWSGKNEELTRHAARLLAEGFLLKGVNVIIDDTNLNPGTLQSWKDLAQMHDVKVEVLTMSTSMEECIKRDSGREDRVGRDVIVNMALQNGLYLTPKKGFVLCDLDGTLCDIKHRLHYLEGAKKDWKGFFGGIADDIPRIEVLDKVLAFEREGYDIIFVSARPDDYREVTAQWLNNTFKGYIPHKTLIMRRSGDTRPDTEVKQQMLDTYFKDRSLIHRVIDDRPRVIEMWRANGLEVIDVGEGIDF